jgi:hypothetical protein
MEKVRSIGMGFLRVCFFENETGTVCSRGLIAAMPQRGKSRQMQSSVARKQARVAEAEPALNIRRLPLKLN